VYKALSWTKRKKIGDEFFRLRALAVLLLFRLTGKRRGEIAKVPLENFKIDGDYLKVTFILEKKRKGVLLQKLSTKDLPLRDPLARHILAYLDYLSGLKTRPLYWLPSVKSVFGHNVIIPDRHLSPRQVFNIVRGLSKTIWCHLFRETAAADIIQRDNSIIAAFKVQRRLDLESCTTGFNYLRRFATDVIQRESEVI
jgi:hypothetical protein